MPEPPPAHLPRLVYRWWWLPMLLATLVGAVWLWPRAEAPAPQARAQTLVQEAAAALARGHLSAADGSGARELYQAAQAIDPDLPEARRGQVEVGRAALARAQAALARADLPAARDDLALARELQVPRAEWAALATNVREQALADINLDALLERADAARAQGWLTAVAPEFPGDLAALPLYQRILALQPGHPGALRGREETLAQLLDAARAALRAGDLETATTTIAHVKREDPGHIDLPDTLARLTEERAGLHTQATTALAQGRVDAAIAGWQRLSALDADDHEARSGLERAAAALIEHAVTLGESLQFSAAERELQRARELSPSAPALHAADVRIARARQRPQAEPVTASLQALGACFTASLAANHLRRARECLDASRLQGEDVGTLDTRRRQLAQRWIAIGEERLGRSDLPAAAAALAWARDIDPAAPGLQTLARRVDTAER